jgi:hypothetical protein
VDADVVKKGSEGAARDGMFDFTDLPVYGIAKSHGEGDFFHGR